jgi:hypothetical protein
MDESRKRGEATPSKDKWHKDKGPAADLGATGVFAAEPSIEAEPGPVTEPVRDGGEAPQFHPPGVRERLQEPIVHKVVLGGGSATAPIDILGPLRTSSTATESAPGSDVATPQRVPGVGAYGSLPTLGPTPTSGPQPSQLSEGFTQLLRTLSGESSPASAAEQPAAVQRTVVSSDSRVADMGSGFTSLLRSLNPDDKGKKRLDPPDPSRTPSSEGAGGFTALLQGLSETRPKPGELQLHPKPHYEDPLPALPGVPGLADPLTAPTPASGQATPGAFTQLFSALTPEATNSPVAVPAVTNPGAANVPMTFTEHSPMSRSSDEQTSFTRLLSTVGESSYAPSPYSDERQSVLNDIPSRRNPAREDPWGSNELHAGITDWSSTAPRQQPESSTGSGGLTQLLRTLDQESEAPKEYAPLTAQPEQPQVGTFTGLHRLLDGPAEEAPPAPYPSNLPSLQPSATESHQSPLTGRSFAEPAPPSAAAPNPTAEPSEYTRIVNMSHLREMQRPGVTGGMPEPSQINTAAVAQPLSSQSPGALTPALSNLQWPPQVLPAQPSGQPLQYSPPPIPLQHSAIASTPSMPTPAPQSMTATPPAMGKMHQYLPLLLIIIIFLLGVILVTLIFLLKH